VAADGARWRMRCARGKVEPIFVEAIGDMPEPSWAWCATATS
jgi:hypothetical protein